MKKPTGVILCSLILVIIFSFDIKSNDENEIIITITADQKTSFDMLDDHKVSRGLTTPYEITLNTTDDKLIFKSKKSGVLKMHVVKNKKEKKAELTAGWSTIVLLIEGDHISTFGM